MAEIVPAIIAKDFEELKDKIKKVEPFVNWVQLDVMDGKFAPEKTWPYICHPELVSGSQNGREMPKQVRHDRIKLLKELNTKLNLEAHLMVEEPEKEIGRWLESGVKRILVHYEAIKNDLRRTIYDLRKKCNEHGVELGLVLNLETPIDVLNDLSEFFPPRDFDGELSRTADPSRAENHKSLFLIQLMSIAQIGYHGHYFDEKVIPKIKALKERCSCVKIAVDGGINKETAKMALSAGADILVAGSAIFNNGNIEVAVKDLRDIHENKIQ